MKFTAVTLPAPKPEPVPAVAITIYMSREEGKQYLDLVGKTSDNMRAAAFGRTAEDASMVTVNRVISGVFHNLVGLV